MEYQYLTVERDAHVAIVKFNRPEKMNALNFGLMSEIITVVESFHLDGETRVVIFTGAGKTFSAGADLSDPEQKDIFQKETLMMKGRHLQVGPRMIRAIYEMDQITIAAVNGAAAGGAACIAAACDFRIGADTCIIGYPEVNLGMNLSWKALPMCVNLVGPARAKRMVILARMEKARTLLDWGFLDKTVPAEELIPAAIKMAEEYAARPPMAAQMVKRSVNAITSATDQAIMHMDSDQYQLAAGSKDFMEGIQSFFEKRKPEFTGD